MRNGVRYLVILSILALLTSPPAGAVDETVPDAVKALDLFNAGNQREAIAAMASAVQKTQDDPALRLTYGVMLANDRRYDEASREFIAASKLLPGDSLPHLLMEGALANESDSPESEDIRKAADEILKNGAGRKALTKSSTMLQSALTRYPKNAIAMNLLGDVRQMLGDGDGAVSAYREAASLASWWVKPHFNLGVAYLATDPAAAANSFARVLQLDPKNLRAYLWLGDAYAEQSRYTEALKVYRKALDSRDFAGQAAVRIGNVYLKQGLSGEAKEMFQQAVRAVPKDAAAQVGLAEAYVREGQYEKGAELYAEAAKLVPASAIAAAKIAVMGSSANAFVGAGDYKRAIDLFKRIIETDPTLRQPYAALADACQRAGLLETSIAEYNGRVKNSPGDSADALILAELQRAAQNVKGAREAFQLALKWAKAEPIKSYAKESLEALPR